jgi:hypothetical protein
MFDGNLLECLNDLREEWIGDFGNDQTKDLLLPETSARAWVFG